MPGRCAGRMRQRNHVEVVPCAFASKFAANHTFQSIGEAISFSYNIHTIDELHDSQSADRDDETRSQNSDLVVHPRRTVANLVWRRNPISAAGIFAGKTSADRREVNFGSNSSFVHSAKFFEPAEKSFASGMRERSLQNRFPRTGSLTNNHHIAHDRSTRHRCRVHARAAPAFPQLRHMAFETQPLFRNDFHSCERSTIQVRASKINGRADPNFCEALDSNSSHGAVPFSAFVGDLCLFLPVDPA